MHILKPGSMLTSTIKARPEPQYPCLGPQMSKHDTLVHVLGLETPMPVPEQRAQGPEPIASMNQAEVQGIRAPVLGLWAQPWWTQTSMDLGLSVKDPSITFGSQTSMDLGLGTRDQGKGTRVLGLASMDLSLISIDPTSSVEDSSSPTRFLGLTLMDLGMGAGVWGLGLNGPELKCGASRHAN